MENIADIADIYELSPMQQGMLFHTIYAPNSGVYFEQLNCTLRGKLNILAFKQAWKQVVSRHTVFRTSFYWEEVDKPLQIVRSHVELPWEQYDWRHLTLSKQQLQLEAFLQADRDRGFELSQAPLMRCTLIQIAEDSYQFIWSHHHILMDGWCLSIILNEVSAFYEAENQGKNLYLEDPQPYRNYITWLQEQDISKAAAFWQQTLQGFNTPTPLTLNRSSEYMTGQEATYDKQHLQLSAKLTDAMQSLARQHRLTVNTLVQGAWALLLSCYSDELDIVFGVTVSGRPPELVGVESMVGLFINTLPVRVQFSEEVCVLPWLQQLQVQQVEREQYTYTSLIDIQGWSDLPRGIPLFESIVVFTDYPLDTSLQEKVGNIEIHNISNFERTNYPLVLEAIPGEELSVGISYNQNRFEAATIGRMLRHLQTLLEGIVADPQQRIAELSLLTATERHQLLLEWNNTRRDYSLDKCIHQLFEDQVEQTPDAVAVVFQDQWLTYRELNERANQVAYTLSVKGVGKGAYVPVLMGRSIELVIALLAIMKAGAAFVPLDIFWPIDRLKQVLEELNSEVILVDQAITDQEADLGLSFFVIDRLAAKNAMPNLNIKIDCGEPIYAIYTSGSTGKPKAVVVPHQGIINRFLWMNEFFGRESATSVLQTTRHVYDSAVWQFFWPLINGGKTVIPSPDISMSADDLTNLIQSQGVTITDFVPSVFNTIVPQLTTDTQVQQKLSSLQTVIVGGEEITPATTYTFLDYFPGVRMVNLYGPTEASIGCICYQVTGKEGSKIPIGKPIANVHVLILDQQQHLVPVGVPGEIYLSGICLALGYLNDESKTKAAFVDHQFGEIGYDKLYKTGDLARYLPDGNIEFLGRIDHQVKIRGIRIELGEIEALLSQHPGVQQTVVIARETRPGDKHLVSFIVPNQKQIPTIEELRHFLKHKLPDYMVPSIFVILESIPLTSGGKVDRRALSTLELSQMSAEFGFVSPRTPTEEILAELWTEVLGLERVGIHDNFFELGGHSLLATQLVSRIRQAFSVALPLRAVFENPTIAELAELVIVQEFEQVETDALKQILSHVEQLSEDEINQQLLQEYQ